MKKNTKKTNTKKPIIIAAVGAGVAAIGAGLVKSFRSMKESAKAQHEVDKAEFAAVKAESRASFEENRGHNTFKKAKEIGKKSWDDAHMTPSERAKEEQKAREARIADAKKRVEDAEERYEAAKK